MSELLRHVYATLDYHAEDCRALPPKAAQALSELRALLSRELGTVQEPVGVQAHPDWAQEERDLKKKAAKKAARKKKKKAG